MIDKHSNRASINIKIGINLKGHTFPCAFGFGLKKINMIAFKRQNCLTYLKIFICKNSMTKIAFTNADCIV